MAEIESRDYHDFVIKDGKLIGEFEQMYRKSEEVPWHQDLDGNRLDVRLVVEMLKESAPYDYICDFGCGLGYFLDVVVKGAGGEGTRGMGFDVSPTCCEKAKELFPGYDFRVLDLMAEDAGAGSNGSDTGKDGKRLFVIRGTLWYVFPEMERVVENIAGITRPGDCLVVSQNFPPLEGSFVGKEVIPDPQAILRWFGSRFIPQKTLWLEDRKSTGNDNWFIVQFGREDK